MESEQADLNLRDYLRILRRHLVLIIGMTVLGSLLALAYSVGQSPQYASTARVRILDPNTEAVFEGAQLRVDQRREVDTQIEIIESNTVREAANAQLGDRSSEIIRVAGTNVGDTDIVAIRVESTDPVVAMDGANAVANAYVEVRRNQTVEKLENRANELRDRASEFTDEIAQIDSAISFAPDGPEVPSYKARREALLALESQYSERAAQLESTADLSTGNAEIVDEAVLPTDPFSPRTARNVVLGALAGLLLGVIAAVLFERLRDDVTPENLATITDAPVLGAIPLVSGRRLQHRHLPLSPRAIAQRDSVTAEAFRTLRTSVRFSNLGKSKQVLAVTSASSEEGKSTVTANLAIALAESGLRVVVISGDLRRPTLGEFYHEDESTAGLTSVLLGDVRLIDALVKVPIGGTGQLAVLTAGPVPPNPAELLGSAQMAEILTRLIDSGADIVLIDCPPVLPVADTLTMAQFVDGVLVVCVPGQTKATALTHTIEKLQQVGAEIVGVVLNGVGSSSGYGSYLQHYGGTYRSTTRPARTPDAASEPPVLDLDTAGTPS